MTLDISFNVQGIPKGQPRPRAFAHKTSTGYVARVFGAGTAEAWKSDIIRCGEPFKPGSPIDFPVRVDITFYFPRPKRLMRKMDLDEPVWAPCKPDRDNADKAVLDALVTAGWLRDDALVVSGTIEKKYHAKTGSPGALIRIRGVEFRLDP